MKTKFFVFALLISATVFISCSKDEETETNPIKNETIDMGPSYVNDIYYSLSNGIVATIPRENWDIAFSVSNRSSSIIINESAKVELKKFTGTWSWDTPIDTTGQTSSSLHNSNTTWEDGAFNQLPTGGYNYGWGDYDQGTHDINGVTKYIIKLRDGSFKKIFIEKKNSINQKYVFRYANIDGTSPILVPELLATGSNANYIYYNLVDNTTITNREPDATTWDLVFTRWYDVSMNYKYATGALQNIGIKAIDLTVDDPANISYTDDQFSANINTVGSYWKTNDPVTHQYTIPANKVYVVKDASGKDFKIVFKSFAGQSTGVLTFDITAL